MERGYCSIHPEEELQESNPADPENGPCAADTENYLFCAACAWEFSCAEMESTCIAHHKMLAECLPCCYAEDSDLPVPVAEALGRKG